MDHVANEWDGDGDGATIEDESSQTEGSHQQRSANEEEEDDEEEEEGEEVGEGEAKMEQGKENRRGGSYGKGNSGKVNYLTMCLHNLHHGPMPLADKIDRFVNVDVVG